MTAVTPPLDPPSRQELQRLQRYFCESPNFPLTAANLVFLLEYVLRLEARVSELERASVHAR